MKKILVIVAAFLILAGLSPAIAPVFAQDQETGPPPPPPGQGEMQNQGEMQYPTQGSADAQPDANSQASAQADASSQPGVARASYIHGDVSSQRGDNTDLIPLTLNTPLEAGDRVSAANDARAELELDYADVLRLSGGATAKIANLNRQNIQVQVGEGLATYSVLPGSQAASEIDTPNAALHPDGPGDYRILVNSDAETKIVVRSGSADVSTPQGSTHVDAGQMITVAGTANPQYRVDAAPSRDDWDTWNADRDHRVETAQSFKDTNQYYTGSEDLDTYGTWSEVPDYGNVWFPNNGPDWAPYRDGTWVYEPYYGWTWNSYEPWGWAPYHYGRWFVYGGRWGWWPGSVYAGYYPMWAPAYVSFFGWGGGFGVGFGFGGWGNIGWLPIGPCDWFHPWYGRWGGRYGVVGFRGGVGFGGIHEGWGPLHGDRGPQYSNMREALTNDRVRSGMSSMAGNDFGRGRVPTNQARISDATLRQSSMMTGRMPVSPSRTSTSPTGHFANGSAFHNMPPASQHFFTANRGNMGANGAEARSFGLASRGESPLGNRNSTEMSRSASQMGAANRSNPQASSQSGRSGWRSFTPPSSANSSRSSEGSQNAAGNRGAVENRSTSNSMNDRGAGNGGWQHFTPQSRESQSQGERGSSRSFQPPAQGSRGGSNSYSRPTLNMRQPIMTPRGGGSYGYSAPRGGAYSAPRGGGNSAPRGGGYSAPRGGGGGSRGGGGSHGGGHGGGGRR